MATTSSSVIEVNDLHALSAYRLQWDALLAGTPRASYFHTFDWLANYWQHYGRQQKLRVLIVQSAGQVIGIVPLVVQRHQHRLTSERVLTYPLDDWGMWYGPIGPNPTATWTLAARHIADSPRDWDAIRLPWVDATGDAQRTTRALAAAGLTTHSESYQETSVIEFNQSWEEYLMALDTKVRHELRRNLRRWEEAGGEYTRHRPEATRAGDGECRWDLYEQCEQVANSSWQAGIDHGNTLCHPRHREFYRDAHASAARLGMVDVNVLTQAGRPVAFCYNYHFRGCVFGVRTGFDPSVERSGAGKALVSMMLRDGFARGDLRLEMGIGDQRYKREIRTGVSQNCKLTHVPVLSLRSQAIDWSRWCRKQVAAKVSHAKSA